MNSVKRNPLRIVTLLSSILLSGATLVSCGGGSSAASVIINAGIGGTGIVFGTITGFGSVWVNGRRFDIDGSEIIIDGESGSAGQLKVGMVVRLDVDTENGMFGGAAAKVDFDDAIQGPLNGAPTVVGGQGSGVKQFTILEQKVTIDATRTLFSVTTFDTIDAGDVVEVSGFRAGPNEIIATWVRKITDPSLIDEIELRGEIEDNIPGVSFKINGVTVNYLNAISIDIDGGQPENGMFVEVEGIFVTHTSVNATTIEQEDEDFGNDVDEISLHGIVAQYDPAGAGLADFLVSGQRVNASSAEREPENLASLMQNGLEVEVEGEIVNGILIAEELELREGDTKVRTTVLSKPASGVFVVEYPGVGTVTVTTSGLTLFEDESDVPIPDYSYNLLEPGHFVEIEGTEINDSLSAQVVKRREPNDVKLQGSVDTFDDVNYSVTILGITYPMDSDAIYEEDPSMTAAAFFAALRINDIVELEDNEPDGFADEVELD